MDVDNNKVVFSNHGNDEDLDLEIPSCLIVANVPTSVFESSRDERCIFEEMFTNFGSADFVYLKSFKRVLVNYESPVSAALAKLALHFTDFQENELKVYFKKTLPESSCSLQLPKPEKQFLISPPASPPVGWEPLEEPIPVVNYDLLTAVAKLSDEPHELHAETPQTPGIVVHACQDPITESIGDEEEVRPLKFLPREIVQTSRPPLK